MQFEYLQECMSLRVILKKSQFDQVVLVTSGIHLTRTLLYFSFNDC